MSLEQTLQPTTALEAINDMLASIGQGAVNSLEENESVDATGAISVLVNTSREVQERGWFFNTDYNYPLVPGTTGEILIPPGMLQFEPEDSIRGRIVERARKLYDRDNHTFYFDTGTIVYGRVVWLLGFEDLPQAARTYIHRLAGRIFQSQREPDQLLYQFTKEREQEALAALTRAELRAERPNAISDNSRVLATATGSRLSSFGAGGGTGGGSGSGSTVLPGLAPTVTDTTSTSSLISTAISALLGDLASTDDGKGADLIGYRRAGTTTTARLARDKMSELVTPEDFGATGDGITDDTAALQAFLDYLASLGDAATNYGGVGYLPAGKAYGISYGLVINKPVRVYGAGPMADTNNANGIPEPNCRIVALDGFPAATAMLRVQAATSGSWLRGGALEGIHLYGRAVAHYGLRMSTCIGWSIDLSCREMIGAGVRLDDANGGYSKDNHFWVDYVVGANTAAETCAASHGLWISGQNYGNPQNFIHAVTGLRRDGDGLRLQGNVDNCLVYHVGVSGDGVGSGTNLAFRDKEAPGTGAGARNNIVYYVAGGNVHAGAATYGNRILAMTSESNSVEIVSGGQLHYAVINYANSGLHETHKYRLSGERAVSASAMSADGTNATKTRAASLWPIVSFAEAADGWAGGNFAEHEWATGNITGIRLHYTAASATAGNYRMKIRLANRGSGDSIASAQLDESFNLPGPASGNLMSTYEHTFASPAAFSRDDLVVFMLDRLGSSDAANDTATTALQLHAIEFLFTSDGPTFGGGGPYDVSGAGT